MGGDLLDGRDLEGFSAFGRNFKDESKNVEFNRRGMLGMMNEGKPDTNASQFIITLDAVRIIYWIIYNRVAFYRCHFSPPLKIVT